ncbi:porin family protein [Sphingomonas sp. KR3-1]|uniref:porin family protein n=1 Tax=Sphingomonas sp. KR3-1 TaxID=3156611 RepID=UPI0032B36A31
MRHVQLPAIALALLVAAPRPAAAQQARAGAQREADAALQAERARDRRWQKLLPFRAEAARRRGYDLPLPFGVSAMYVHNVEDLASSDLAVAFAKGGAVPAGTTLTPVPFVTTDGLRGRSGGVQFRADAWLLPNLNLFVNVGRMQGSVDVGVDIDLSQIAPAVLCRNGRCQQHLDFKATVDNVTVTTGAIAVYGGQHWFGSVMASHTESFASKERSDIRTSTAGVRVGPRFHPGRGTELTVYGGGQYLDIDTVIEGALEADDLFADGDALGLRYRTRAWNPTKWAAVFGFNLQIAKRWALQAEYQGSKGNSRAILGAGFRF